MVRAMSEKATTAPALKPGDHLFLVDGSNFIFRAYFQSINQDRKYNARSDGLPSGAVRLFATKLFQFVREGVLGVRPTHLAIVFDKSENSFRKAIYPAYKGNRSEPPADLIPQFPLMREAVRAFGLIPVEQDVYEADDLIATYAKQAREAGADVLIVSADKDLMQLVKPGVAMLLAGALLDAPSILAALWPAAAYYVLHLIEGNAVTPVFVGSRLTISPFLVFIAFIFWLWLWGPVGAVLSTPIVIVAMKSP